MLSLAHLIVIELKCDKCNGHLTSTIGGLTPVHTEGSSPDTAVEKLNINSSKN